MTPQERLNHGLYTADANGIIGIYEDIIDTTDSISVPPKKAASESSATKIVGYIQRAHNSKEAQIRLAIEAIGKAISDYDKALKQPPGQPLDRDRHIWVYCKSDKAPEYPTLSLIANQWQECVQKSRIVDIKPAQEQAQIEGRERFATAAEVARMTDKQRQEEYERFRSENDRIRLQTQLKVAEFDKKHPELAPRVRAYCLAMWGDKVGKSDRMILVTYERALAPGLGWEIPTPAQVRANRARGVDVAPQPTRFKTDPNAVENLEKMIDRTVERGGNWPFERRPKEGNNENPFS